jgi:hypothetical protein
MATQSQQQEEAVQAAQKTGMDPAVMTAAGSVLLSWYFFFIRGDREMGLFVGLWPPTILAFASYFEQTRMSDMIHRSFDRDRTIGRMSEEGIVEQIKQRV